MDKPSCFTCNPISDVSHCWQSSNRGSVKNNAQICLQPRQIRSANKRGVVQGSSEKVV